MNKDCDELVYGYLNRILDWTMGYTSFVGTLLYFVPIIILFGGVRFFEQSRGFMDDFRNFVCIC